jgi:hypothetical protein
MPQVHNFYKYPPNQREFLKGGQNYTSLKPKTSLEMNAFHPGFSFPLYEKWDETFAVMFIRTG